MPALYALAVRRLLPERFGIVGAARTEETDDAFRERMKQAVKDHARDPFDDEAWERLAAGMHYVTLDFADDQAEDELRDTLDVARRGARARMGTASTTSRFRRARSARSSRRSPQRRGGRGLDQADHREAVRARPRLGARAERGDPAALHRGRGLPDRPLPRQGDRPEHAGAAVRERHLRADLEQAVHRPRPDHRRRVDRDRGPRRLLRAGRRDPRHLPEPPACSSSRSRRWSRRSTSPPTRCGTRR